MNIRIIFFIVILNLTNINTIMTHDEYYKYDSFSQQLVLTHDPSEAIIWNSYTNLPIWIKFSASSVPYYIDWEDFKSDFQRCLCTMGKCGWWVC